MRKYNKSDRDDKPFVDPMLKDLDAFFYFGIVPLMLSICFIFFVFVLPALYNLITNAPHD